MLEKRLMIIVGVIVAVFLLMVITGGAAWPFLIVGVLAYLMWKNNR